MYFWFNQNSGEVLDKLNFKGFQHRSASSLSAYGFSTLYMRVWMGYND